MAKRKTAESSSDEEDETPLQAAASSPDRPLNSTQTARRSGKKAKTKDTSNEDIEEENPPKKSKAKKEKEKPKAAKPPSIKKPKLPPVDDDEEDTGDIKVGVTSTGERFVDLGKRKRATVRSFKGGRFLDIREFYGDDDDLKPGKKGISITQEQWEHLKKSSNAIDSFFERLDK